MKPPGKSRFAILLFCAAILLGARLSCANAQPTIFHYTQTANPGDVIGLQGDSFGNSPQVWMLHVTGTENSLVPQVQLTILTSTGSLAVTNSNSYVSALIPANETPGLYAIWVSSDSGATFGQPTYINQARAWGANDLCGTQVDPGRAFRLFGRNLYFSGATPAVRFVSGTTSLTAAVTGSGSDAYSLNVTAPAGLISGTTYTVFVRNGFGSAFGETAGVTLTGRAGGSDPFGLYVPWGANYTFSGNVYNVQTDPRLTLKAAGDGVTNDAPAIQAAVNAANAAGGGVVYMPAGTYKISGSSGNLITLRSNVVLEGAGMDVSVLSASDTAGNGYRNLYASNVTNVGLMNLTLYNTTTGWVYSTDLESCTNVFMIGTKLQTETDKNCFWNTNYNVLIRGSTIIALQADGQIPAEPLRILGNTDQIFKNNTVNWYFGRVNLDDAVRSLIEDNHFTRSVVTGTTRAETGGLSVANCHSLVVLSNTFDKSGTGPLVMDNDGETILCQGGGNAARDLGTATGATSTTLTDSTKDWVKDYSIPDPGRAGEMYYVTIVGGPGLGQFRQIVSNSANTLTVDSPWAIIPTNASKYSIEQHQMQQALIQGNILSQNPKGIMLYVVSAQDVTVANNTLTDNGGISFFADYRPADVPPTDNVQLDCVATGNSVTKDVSWYPTVPTFTDAAIFAEAGITAGYTDFGTRMIGMEFRDNSLTAMTPNEATGLYGDGFASIRAPSVDGTTEANIGTIFQGNTAVSCSNAFHLSTGDYNTALWNNVVIGAGSTLLYDGTSSGTSHGSIANSFGGNLLPGAPAITTQPVNRTVLAGQSGTFSVIATGTPSPTYQWQENGVPIAGATSANYTTPATALGDSGSAFCAVVANSAGTVTSSTAVLTVNPSYASWQSTYFTPAQQAIPSVSGLTADPSGDGMSNLMKYAFNLNPNVSNCSAGPSVSEAIVGGTTYLYITHRQNLFAPEVSFSYEQSADLLAWNPFVPELVSTATLDPSTHLLTLRAPVNAQPLFLRVKISWSNP